MSRWLILFLGLVVAAPGRASDGASRPSEPEACALRVARRVQERYDAIRDLQAHFEQITQSVTLGSSAASVLEARGEVTFAKPGRMRWSYQEPEPSLVVSDGSTLWIYDPAAAEVQRMTVSGAFLSGAAIQFLLGEGDILKEFVVRSEDCAPGGDAAPGQEGSEVPRARLELHPRQPASYERLELLVDPLTGEVHATSVHDLFGNVTRVELSRVRTDLDPPSDLFVFEPPPGVRVLDLSEQP